jgi:hypothetical protein
VQLIGQGLNNSGRFDEQTGVGLDQILLGVPIRIFGE